VAGLRVRSTFGQHIFLGSYLVVLVPLTLARFDWALRERAAAELPPGGGRPGAGVPLMVAWVVGAVALVAAASRWPAAWWGLGAWGLAGALACARIPAPLSPPALLTLVAAQAGVVLMSQARGALVGLAAGLIVAGVPLAWQRRARKTLAVGAAVLAAFAVVVLLANLPGSPGARLGKAPGLRRLTLQADLRPGSPEWVRVQVWRGVVTNWVDLLRGEQVLPTRAPHARALVGYGLETQLRTLDRLALPSVGALTARGEGFRARYLVDRAHSVPLDHLLTGGLLGLGLWLAATGGALAVGVRALRGSEGPERAMRAGALGAVAGQLTEGLVGIATPVPLALGWLAAGLLVAPPWRATTPAGSPPRRWRLGLAAALGLLVLAAVLVSTRWLLASVAYAEGTRLALARQLAEAVPRFDRARALMPWVSLSGEALAYAQFRLAVAEGDPARRRAGLERAEKTAAETRAAAGAGGAGWTLAGQIAFAQARGGDRAKLDQGIEALALAVQWRPADSHLQAQWGWALLEQGQIAQGRRAAHAALAVNRKEWLALATLARAARLEGDTAEAERLRARAEAAAPPEASATLKALLD
jgi:hypothetical protein